MENYLRNMWKMFVQTYELLSKVVDYWIVDIKSMRSWTYEKYTGHISGVLQHLYCLKKLIDDKSKITIKVPHIPGYNDYDELDKDIEEIKECYGFMNVNKIQYIAK